MHRGALRALEFEKIVVAAASYALTPTGAARLLAVVPETDAARIERAQDHTAETVRYLRKQPVFPLRAPENLEELLALLAIEGRALEASQLLGVAGFLESVEHAATAIRQASTFSRLSAIVGRTATFGPEVRELRRQIDDNGEVLDDATPALRSIRERLRRQRGRLRESLDSFLRARDTSKYLQEQVVTERNGRFVVLVKAEHKTALPGIVHGSSASGATLFVEPLATVDINNDIVALEEQEREEIHRILLALTDRFRRRLDDVAITTEVATELDVLQARAQLAATMDAVQPVISADGGLRLRGARHPLLMKDVVRRFSDDVDALPESAVPVDVVLEPPDTALLITGPNTGGKTVALKTAGLLALMSQSGFHIPVEPGSMVPAFQSVFADIGDEQSISASLSTFSWHVRNIASMDRELRAPALVLLDEIGAGTDPVEGAALGIGIIEHFRSRGSLVIGTTHYDALKSFASTTPGVVCAAFGFEPDGFRPTYRLSYGTPGRSLALEIAGRLGIADAILTEARRRVGDRESQLQEHLARIDRDVHALDEERDRVAKERQALSEQQAVFAERDAALRERESQFRRRATERIDERVREARREIDTLIEDLKKRTSVLTQRVTRDPAMPRLNTGQTGAARAQAQAAVDEVAERLTRTFDAPFDHEPSEERSPEAGDRVTVGGFGLEGTVITIHRDGHADVDVRGKRMRARVSDLRIRGRRDRNGAGAPAAVRVNVHVQPREGLLSEINVIGCTVDEALTRTDRFLDETLITEQRSVRVVHGHGKGHLRRAIAELLKDHPLVASFHAAPPEQGGGGVTVVELKD